MTDFLDRHPRTATFLTLAVLTSPAWTAALIGAPL